MIKHKGLGRGLDALLGGGDRKDAADEELAQLPVGSLRPGKTIGPIEKPGYYMGAQIAKPVTSRVHVGASITREELTRDDSLIQYLHLNNLYGVTMGKKDRALIARGFIDVNRLVNVSFFWMDVSNPFPWASGSWPVSGPVAFPGREPDRVGVSVTVRTP